MGKDINNLEKYALRYTTITKFAKNFGKSFDEMKTLLFEQNVVPGNMNPENYQKLKSESLDRVAKYYKVSLSCIYKTAASQHLNKPLYDISRRDLIRKINEGMSAKDLSKFYGVSYDKMLRFLKENKVLAKKKIVKVSTKQVHKLFKENYSLIEISNKLGCTVTNVRYHLNKEV